MTQQHPITPPPELIKQWYMEATGPDYEGEIARRAAQWGADQELEACRMEIIDGAGLFYIDETSDRVRLTEDIWTARRPKPPSLKEQALQALAEADVGLTELEWPQCSDTIRRALEQLPDNN
jgi:hypothetical protein